MKKNKKSAVIRIITALIAVIFGILTVFVGGRVLSGSYNPGYAVFFPLLIFNFVMGFFYAGTGFLIWKNHKKALSTAQIVFLLNLFALLIISILYLSSHVLAMESLAAMTFRTAIWFVIFMVIR